MAEQATSRDSPSLEGSTPPSRPAPPPFRPNRDLIGYISRRARSLWCGPGHRPRSAEADAGAGSPTRLYGDEHHTVMYQ